MADAAAAASNAMDTATETGCFRCTLDTGFTSLIRKCHSRHRPLAIPWIASSEDAQVASVIQLRRGNCCVELFLAVPLDRGRQWQSGEQRSRAGIGMDLEFAGRAGLEAYDRPLGFVAE